MDPQAFQELAGGIYQSSVHWKHKSSVDKRRKFWSFFQGSRGTAFSIYAGISVSELLKSNQYSIEHIIPRSYLDDNLRGSAKQIRCGATINPFNLAASHKRINARRGSSPFDYDDDPINKEFRTSFKSIHKNQIGLDQQGQWIVPYRHRGDIARSVLYMHLIYPLPKLPEKEIDTLIAWGKMDQPSNWERKYCDWVSERLNITNPFILQPELVKDLELMKAITLQK